MEEGPPNNVSNEWLTIPNLLSLGRLLTTPLMVWLILSEQRLAATILLAVMGSTDFLDGYIARRSGTVTQLGVLLDPVSDRVLVMSMIVALMVQGSLPLWLGTPVLVRDALLSVAFMALARQGFGKPKVRKVGKSATFALLFSLPGIVAGPPFLPFGLALFFIGGVLYYVAAYRYVQDVLTWRATREVA